MKCPQPYVVWHSEFQASEYPCGRCLACRQLRARDWAQRIKYELEDRTKLGDFVTFTFDDARSEPLERLYLNKKILQNTFKRMRHHHKFSYYAVGEYGERFGRSHYHGLILRNAEVPIDYEKYWKKGDVHVGAVTDASIAYCTGYILKANPVPYGTPKDALPFHIWSRGIGDEWMKGKKFIEMVREGNVPRRWRALADPAEIPPEVYIYPKDMTKGWEKYGRRREQRAFQERAGSRA